MKNYLHKKKQIENSFFYLLPVVVGTIIPFFTLAIFTRILTKEDYGALALVQIFGTFITGLANFGLLLIYERNFFEYRAPKEAAQLLYTTLFFVLSSLALCFLITYILQDLLASWLTGSTENSFLLFWATVSSGLLSLKMYYLAYFKNTEDAKPFVWYRINESILGAVISIFLVVYMRIGVMGIVLGQLAAGLAILLTLSFRFLKKLSFSINFRILVYSLKISYPLTISLLFKVIERNFDKYMLSLLSNIGGVGIYSIGQRVANVAFLFMTAIQNVFLPQVYKKMFELGKDGGKSIGNYLTPFLYISISIGLLISLFSEEIIRILTPQSYHGCIDIVMVLSMLYGSYFFGKQPQLIFAKKTYISSALTLLRIGINIGINIPFIMKWGAIGAAWGTLTAGLISGAISFIVAQRFYEIKWEYTKVALIFLIFFGSTLLLILLRYVGVAYELRVVAKAISSCAYLWLGTKLNVLTKGNFLLIKGMIFPVKVVGA